MKPLIEEGYVYIAQPPLYKISQNKKVIYAYNDVGFTYYSLGTWNALTGTLSVGTDTWSVNPLMTNPAGGDYSLQTGSPAINAGVDVGLTTDILGHTIIGLPDIGAYEYGY